MTPNLWEPIAAFGLSVGGAWFVLLRARRAGLLDFPNHRSSHSVPTPRGGGIALVSAVVAVVAYEVSRLSQRSYAVYLFLLAAITALTVVGWVDDRGSVRVAIRLSVHCICGVAVALLVNEVAPLPGLVNMAWLVWWSFWTVASINVVNFMDGIDGMIAAQGVVYGAFLFSLAPASSFPSRAGLILAAACLGFLMWNWPPARMFMGDVGSGPLGFFFVIGGALAVQRTRAMLVFLPLFPLFLDALLTMIFRFQRGEKLTDAHRTHLYQRLANGGWGHAPVSTIYALAASMGSLIAFSFKDSSTAATAAAGVSYAVMVFIGWTLLHKKVADSPPT